MFKALALIVGTMCVAKGIAGLVWRGPLYGWVRREAQQPRPGPALRAWMGCSVTLIALVWYATLTRYVPYGWVLTALLSVGAVKVYAYIAHWDISARWVLAWVDGSPATLRWLDVATIVVGIGVLELAVAVY